MSEAIDGAIQKMVGAIENVAPKAWSLLVREQRLTALAGLIQDGIAFILFAVWLYAATRTLRPFFRAAMDARSSDMEGVGVIGSVATIALGVVIAVLFVISAFSAPGEALRYLNPDVYAARALIGQAGK
jgi:hypothetical protein